MSLFLRQAITISLFFTGVFFLFGAGRLAVIQSQPQRAIEFYKKAIEVQSQFRNLHHISFWEIAIANFALCDVPASLDCWLKLEAEATVGSHTSQPIDLRSICPI